jgi:hypothetical protein
MTAMIPLLAFILAIAWMIRRGDKAKQEHRRQRNVQEDLPVRVLRSQESYEPWTVPRGGQTGQWTVPRGGQTGQRPSTPGHDA